MKWRPSLTLLCLTLSMLPESSAAQREIALVHIDIVDVRTGAIEPDMTVVIGGDRIISLGPAKKTKLSNTEIQKIDGTGKFLIPGLWDMHVHTDGDDRMLHLLLANGITGVRDMAGDVMKLASARQHILSGELIAPHLVFAGPMLEGPPSQADDETWIIRSPEEARLAVEKLVKLQVDFIKVHDNLSRDSYMAIVAASKENKIVFAGHVPASITPAEASDSGQKSIEHFEFIPKPCSGIFAAEASRPQLPSGCSEQSLDALLHLFARNETWLDPTVQSFRYFAPAQWDAIFAEFRKLVPLIQKNHVLLLAGTDSSTFLEEKGDPPGASLHDELALLIDAGFSPLEALQAATLNPTRFLRLSESLGTIEAGKKANLVILGANPLQEIRNTKRIVAVVLEGRYLDRQALDHMLRENCHLCSEKSTN
jgi:imidazolonepropionase-like amidohydrolase